MPALTPDTIRTATEPLSRLTDYLLGNPHPEEALALAEPLLDEHTGIPMQLADILRALARTVQEHPDTPRTLEVDFLVAELRDAAWEQSDQHTLHYALDDLRSLVGKAPANEPECCWCR
ncbi:hypothetical protein [Streptomyces sp. H27-C3]|uniref:hypothetical protein n=1 Tax=Streptomyces sp. H27-C3 TaxID=3046305 RepID=UPI0024B89307|nr:hypothetical protein [Streptomyces sp. H27-C3]MDJ0464708.1 hypothetical protein [Streptomyces sp. H27-C3]